MPANDVELAEEVTRALAGAEFSACFKPERVYVPDWDLKAELGELQVCVFPDTRTASSRERGCLNKVFRVGVAFAQRLKARELAEIDKLLALTQEVSDFLELKFISCESGRRYQNTGWEDRVRFDPTQLSREKRPHEPSSYSGNFLSVTSYVFLLLR
jgi:hypothetical protein